MEDGGEYKACRTKAMIDKTHKNVAKALKLLKESEATYCVMVEFKASPDVVIDSRGDSTKGQRSKFLQSLYHYWSGVQK